MTTFAEMVEEARKMVSVNPDEAAKKFIRMYAKPVENSLIAMEVFRS
jgi:hypothetical protein